MRTITLSLLSIFIAGTSPAFAARTNGGAQETQVYRVDGSLISGDEAARILSDAGEIARRSPERGVQLACNGFFGGGGPARPCPAGPGAGVIIIRPAPGYGYVPPASGWVPAPLFDEGEVTVRRRSGRDYDEEEVTVTRRRSRETYAGSANTCRSGIFYRLYEISNLRIGQACRVPLPNGTFVWGEATLE